MVRSEPEKCDTVRRLLFRHWFLVALLVVLVTGIGCFDALTFLSDLPWLRPAIILTVMLLMALPLRLDAFTAAVRYPAAPATGVFLNSVLAPLVAWAVVALLQIGAPVGRDTLFGILIAATVPCTLASASVWTRRAGGNDAVSIMVTIVTNALCFLVTPAWLWIMIGQLPDFEPIGMVARLGFLIVLPIAMAQLLRVIRPVGSWASENKASLSTLAQCGVLMMVLLGAIRTGVKLSENDWSIWFEIVAGTSAVLTVHGAVLAAGLGLSRLFHFDRCDGIAVGLAGSQKTLPVGLEVCAQLGVTILPMLAWHVGQLLVDTVVADRLRAGGPPERTSG
jgi:sodium/bile acid cotransporter 7